MGHLLGRAHEGVAGYPAFCAQRRVRLPVGNSLLFLAKPGLARWPQSSAQGCIIIISEPQLVLVAKVYQKYKERGKDLYGFANRYILYPPFIKLNSEFFLRSVKPAEAGFNRQVRKRVLADFIK